MRLHLTLMLRYWQTRNMWIPVISSSMLILVTFSEVTAWSCTSQVSDSMFVKTSLVNVSLTYGTSYLSMSWTHRPSTRSITGWMMIGKIWTFIALLDSPSLYKYKYKYCWLPVISSVVIQLTCHKVHSRQTSEYTHYFCAVIWYHWVIATYQSDV